MRTGGTNTKGRAIRTVIVSFAMLIGNAGALAQVAELAPKLVPQASKAREALLNHPTLAPFEIEAAIRDALVDAAAIPERCSAPSAWDSSARAIPRRCSPMTNKLSLS